MKKKRKILIMTNHFYPEQFRINDIAEEWVKRGYIVSVVSQTPNYPNGSYYDGYGLRTNVITQTAGIHIRRLPVIPRGNNSIMLFLNYISYFISSYCYSIFTRNRPDIIFVYQTSPIFIVGAAKLLAKRRNVPYYVNVLDVWPQTFFEMIGTTKFMEKILISYCKNVYSSATKLFISSKGFLNLLVETGLEGDSVIYWPQYSEDFYNFLEKPAQYKYFPQDNIMNFTFTGNVGEAQGLEILSLAAVKLKEANVLVRFNIVGSGRYLDTMIKSVEDNKVMQYFNFIERVPASEISSILAETDVAVLTLKDNKLFNHILPAKLQSYMACGKPILGSVSGEASSLISNANCGYSSKPNDVDGFVDNVFKFTNLSSEQLNKLGSNSKSYNEDFFNKDTLLNEMDKYLLT